MLKSALWAGAFIFLSASFAPARDTGHFDASVGWGGVFNKTSTTLAPTNSGMVLGTFRCRFNRMHGIELNVGRNDNTQVYLFPPNNYRVQTTVTEYSGAYVLSPFQTTRLEPFLLGGAGALRFYPGNTDINGFQSAFGARQQTSLAFLYGGGVDYRLWRFAALRLQYRGLIFKEPNFHLQQFFTSNKGHMAEPSIGFVIKF